MLILPAMIPPSSSPLFSSPSSSSSPLSHALVSDGYSNVLCRLDSLKDIFNCGGDRGQFVRFQTCTQSANAKLQIMIISTRV